MKIAKGPCIYYIGPLTEGPRHFFYRPRGRLDMWLYRLARWILRRVDADLAYTIQVSIGPFAAGLAGAKEWTREDEALKP